MKRPMFFGAAVHPFRVFFPNGAYRSFAAFDVFNAYLLALEDQGHKWTFIDEKTVAFGSKG